MAFLYPWGNTQQLNLDWILQKIKELEAGGGADLDEVANALISATYARQAYDRSDIVFYDGKLYRANQAIPAPGEVWTPAHWDEILLGDTVSNLVQYVAALSNDQIANSSSVSGTYTSDALDTLKNAIDGIAFDSDGVSNVSQVTGDNVSDALDNLQGEIDDEKERVIMLADATRIAVNTDFNSLTTYGNYYVSMTSEAATMPNIPIQRAGRLIVRATISDGTSYVGQIFIPYFGAMAYFRDTNNNGATWSDWETFSNLRGEIVPYLEPKMEASRAYAKGDYMDYGGTLYKALTAIANQDALTAGTNVIATTVCAELLAKIDKTITKGVVALNTNYLISGGLIEYYEIGDLVIVTVKDIAFTQVVPNSSAGNNINLLLDTLPKPTSNTVFLANYISDVASGRATQRFRVNTDGELTVWWHDSVVSTTNTCFFTVIYKKA